MNDKLEHLETVLSDAYDELSNSCKPDEAEAVNEAIDVIRAQEARITDLEAALAASQAECERLRVGNHMLQKRVLELSENEAVASANFKDAQRVIVELSNRLKDVTNQARTNHVTPPKEAE